MVEKITCEKALEIYNKLKQQYHDIFPAGGLLLCMAGAINETHDVDVVSKVHDRFTKEIIDNVVVHIFPWVDEMHNECYSFDNYLAIYYCTKYKLYKLSLIR